MRRITATFAAFAATAAVAAGGVAVAAPASAVDTTGCTPMEGGAAYLTSFGDTNNYVLAPGGTFSNPATAWQLSRSSISTSDNSSANVSGDSASGTLNIGFTGKAVSPQMCVRWQDDRIRFFYKALAGTSFKVSTTGSSSIGSATVNTWITAPNSGWNLTPAILIPDWTDASGTELLKVTITNPIGATVKVDDMLIDPWRNRGW